MNGRLDFISIIDFSHSSGVILGDTNGSGLAQFIPGINFNLRRA